MTLVIIVILANVNRTTISADTLYPHCVAKGTDIPNSNRVDLRHTTGSYAIALGIARPLVGITYAAPVRHVAKCLLDFPGCIADAFTVIHTPCVDQTVLSGII